MHHPWRDLRNREHVRLYFEHMPPGMRGGTNGTDIWMEKRLLQVERRCTLTHELVHMDLGHEGCQDERTEARVRRATARRLLTVEQLVEVVRWTDIPEEMADELWVTVDVLTEFTKSLTAFERKLVDHAWRCSRG